MAFMARVRGVEVICETLDDLDAIIDRYGSEAAGAGQIRPSTKANGTGHGGADMALLRTFVNAGSAGVSSKAIGDMLGTSGKGVPPTLQKWGVRVGLAQGDGMPFEQARPQGKRGWKLTDGAMDMARHLLTT